MTETTLTLHRTHFDSNFTQGVLDFCGRRYFSIEDTVRILTEFSKTTAKGKVDGKTAIPAGKYEIKDTLSPKYSRMMLTLENVPGFQGIRIHSGNTADDTEGCLILGFKSTANGVIESRDALVQFNLDVRKALSQGQVFILIINE